MKSPPFDRAKHQDVGQFPGNVLNLMAVHLIRYGHVSYQREECLKRVGPFNEIQFILEGREIIEADRGRFAIGAGNVCLIPLSKEVCIQNQPGLKKLFFQCNLVTHGTDLFLNEKPIIVPIKPSSGENVSELWGRATHVVENGGFFKAKGILHELLGHLEKTIISLFQRKQSHHERYERFFDYARATPLRDFSLEDIATAYGVHPNYFSQEFKRFFGVPAKAFVLQEKIRLAKVALIETGENIQTIAARLGFFDAFHLSKTFKKMTGESPTEFREAHLEPLSRDLSLGQR